MRRHRERPRAVAHPELSGDRKLVSRAVLDILNRFVVSINAANRTEGNTGEDMESPIDGILNALGGRLSGWTRFLLDFFYPKYLQPAMTRGG